MNWASWATELKSHTETQEFSEQQIGTRGVLKQAYLLKTLTLAFSLEHIRIDGRANNLCSLAKLHLLGS